MLVESSLAISQFLMMSSSSPSAGMRTAPTSPSSRGNSPTHGRADSSPTTPSFFIIQEPAVHVAPRDQSPKEKKPPETSVRQSLDTQRTKLASRQSHDVGHSLNSGSPGPRRRWQTRSTGGDAAAVLREEIEEDLMVDSDEDAVPCAEKSSQPRVLSILNRCGSSPELPLHNTWSNAVFSSSKKRQLLKPTGGTGGSPQFTAIQRSRLIPLPINIRTGTFKKPGRDDDDTSMNAQSLGSLRVSPATTTSTNDFEEQKMNYEISIATLKQRISHMEKELNKALKRCQSLDKQIDCVTSENHALISEKKQYLKKIDDLEKSTMQQRHAFDKLTERYALVYENLTKLTDITNGVDGGKQNNPGYATASTQQVLQTLARENQELQRKVRVLEARHTDDKTIIANQEKQIRRLRAEMEALQHMAGSNDLMSSNNSPSAMKLTTQQSELNRLQPLPLASGSATVTTTVSNPSTADEYAYVDPNILKVLEKVDSQFSITNAIALAAVLKKWLHSSLNVVASTDLHGVLHVLLKRACELLHCQHAAIFYVDHAAKHLVGVASERGLVHWEMPLDKGVLGHCARNNVLCNVRKAYDDPRFYSTSDSIMGTKSHEVLCIPLTRELERDQKLTPGAGITSTAVFAVIQCWNTTTQKPFSQNDQILGGLLAIQAGIVLTQTKLVENMQRVHNRVLQIVRMDEELASKASAAPLTDDGESPRKTIPTEVSVVHLVRAAQRKLAEIIGVTKLRIFIIDADLARVWHVGAQLDSDAAGATTEVQLVRKYANVHSSLCSLLIGSSSGSSASRILLDPTSEPTFNDTADLKGGAHGLYIVSIRSPWRDTPLGMIQIARCGMALGPLSTLSHSDANAVAKATLKEKQNAQNVEDALTLELTELFSRQFASLLHHALSLQAFETCPVEIRDAQLAYLVDRLDALEKEYLREQEAAEAEAESMARYSEANARLEQKLLQSVLQEERAKTPINDVSRPNSGVAMRPMSGAQSKRDLEPQPLISTDSTYAIDVTGFGDFSSSPELVNDIDPGSSRLTSDYDTSAVSSFSPSDVTSL